MIPFRVSRGIILDPKDEIILLELVKKIRQPEGINFVPLKKQN